MKAFEEINKVIDAWRYRLDYDEEDEHKWLEIISSHWDDIKAEMVNHSAEIERLQAENELLKTEKKKLLEEIKMLNHDFDEEWE